MTDFKALIGKVASGQALARDEAEAAFGVIMSGEATPSQMGGFLMALRVRGETVDEIAGAVATMRARLLPVVAPPGAIDVVGTGGDAVGTYNISTTAAFVVAGADVPVAKHGNRALSSKSGAADVLAALGVKIDLSPEMIGKCIREAGIGFMFAPAHHAAMKFVGPTRVELGTRTIFNLLGPLANPAGVKRLLVGVFSPDWVMPIAEALLSLGAEAAWVVHGAGGVDEISRRRADDRRRGQGREDNHLRDLAERRQHRLCADRGDPRRRRQAERRSAERTAPRRTRPLSRHGAHECRRRPGGGRQGRRPHRRRPPRRRIDRRGQGARPAGSAGRGFERVSAMVHLFRIRGQPPQRRSCGIGG